MHIKELRVAGFKSFVDPVRAPIEAGLTGVVGPNGCGKSNLLEAVRWAMGAASAKALRAGDMDDVIFAGAQGRPPREHAEVTVVLGDAVGRGPGAHASAETLEITRRILRESGSTYRINGKEVRAKDVQMLFADASTGANSPALVRQGQISELIAAKPENRRRILEDAAGVAGLHARRHEADLKLNAAAATLERVEVAAREMDAQTAALRRQARQAERYRQLAEDIRRHEALLQARRLQDARAGTAAAEAALRTAERAAAEAVTHLAQARRAAEAADAALPALAEEDAVAAAVLRKLEGERVGLERDVAEALAARGRLDEDHVRTENEVRRAEADIAAADEAFGALNAEAAALGSDQDGPAAVAAAEARHATADAARAAADAALDAAQEAFARADAVRAGAQAAIRAADETFARAAARAETARAAMARAAAQAPPPGLDEARAKAALAEADAAAAAKALEAAERALVDAESAERAAKPAADAASQALRALGAEAQALERLLAAPAGRWSAALDAITVEPGYERALAAALGEDLEAALDTAAPIHWAGAPVPDIVWPPGAASLATVVRAPAALAARLALCAVADAEAALDAFALPPGGRIVTKAGALRRWDGFVRRADAPTAAALRLEQKNRLAALRDEIAAAEGAASSSQKVWEAAFAARETALAVARAARAEAPRRAAQAKAASTAIEAHVRARAADEAKAAATRAQAEEADRALDDARQARAACPPAPDAADRAALEAARTDAAAARAAASAAAADLRALTASETTRRERRAAIGRERAAWTSRQDEARARRADGEARLERLARDRAAAQQRPQAAEAALARLLQSFATAERRRTNAADALAAGQLKQRQAHGALRGAEAETARARGEVERCTSALGQERAARDAIEAQGADLDALLAAAGPLRESPLAQQPAGDIDKRLERLMGERDAAGPVNLRAEEELAEALSRGERLAREKADVEQAIAKLRAAIARLNAEARRKLSAAFVAIDGHFRSLFTTLFEGGEAALALSDADDPLAAGLEIRAAPPGKKLASLSLMSGGEQALTATALIFAVFLANPAPICVLDEVDAPLDDANVERFCRLLDDMKTRTHTRFMVITHNPVTMARMDRLYGVTMGERGVSQLVSVDLQRAAALVAQ